MRIAYFVHNIEDAAVLKRVALFELGGARCQLIGFKRFDDDAKALPQGTISLGRTYDSQFFHRIASVIRAMAWPFGLVAAVKDADAIVCRNLEMLALGWFVRCFEGSSMRLTYEVLDIHRKLLGDSLVARSLRAIERFLMRRCDLVITSSPGFIHNYFHRVQRFAGRLELVENKLLPAVIAPPSKSASAPWVIGWFGIIRCQKSLSLLIMLTERLPMLQVIISGRIARQEFDDFDRQIADSPNITYTGPYAPRDLSNIYGQAQFVWAIDYYEEGDNSTWLLPNRLYDSLAYGCVPIALGNVETGAWLRARNLGLVISDPLQALPGIISQMSQARLEDLRQAIAKLYCEDFVHTEASARRLVDLITVGGPQANDQK